MFTGSDIRSLKAVFHGDVVQLGDPSFPELCKVFNGMIEIQPALIAQCAGRRRRGRDPVREDD